MLLRNHIFVYLVPVLVFLILGCQGGSGPTAPEPVDQPGLSTGSDPVGFSRNTSGGGHQLLSLVEVRINAETNSIEVLDLRTAMLHLDLIQLIPIYCNPVAACLDFINLEIDFDTAICNLDILVTHPVPDSYADVFDMRGIGIFKSNEDFGFTIGPVATQILNADGWTTAYDVGGYYTAELNPYVAFNTELPMRIFANMTSAQEHVTCQFPSLEPEDAAFLYALDATWSDPLFYDEDDVSTDPNMADPYEVNIIYIDPIADTFLAEGTAIIEVFDWQDNVDFTEIEVPDLFGGTLNMNEAWSEDGRYMFYRQLTNDSTATPGIYRVLVKSQDELGSGPDLVNPNIIIEYANYQMGGMVVYDDGINTRPTAHGTVSNYGVPVGTEVHFDASGSTDPEDAELTSFAWDLDGDGEFDDGFIAEMDFTYNDIGSFPVNVLVTDSGGLTDVLDAPLVVTVSPSGNTPPVAVAEADKTEVDLDEIVTFDASASYDAEDGTVASYEWDLDEDGTYDDDTGSEVTYSWDTEGTYYVDVLVKDSGGLGDTLDETIEIQVSDSSDLPPTAVATADKLTAEVGEIITFDGTGSFDPEDGDVTMYFWDLLGAKTYSDAFTGIVFWQYWDPGTYEVDLKVTDSKDQEDTLDTLISIEVTGEPNQPPVAIAEASKYLVAVDEIVHFDATDSYDPEEGDPAFLAWDLTGDGAYFDAFTPEVDWFYDTPGEYHVDVRVCDTPGLCDTLDDKLIIQVVEGGNQPPVAIANASQTFVFEGDIVFFDGNDSYDPEDGNPTSWQWDLDFDGEYDDSPFILASKQYDFEGEYYVDLKVTDSLGAWDILDEPLMITVMPAGSNFPPEAIAEVNCAAPFAGQQLIFTDSSVDPDGEILSWEWDFDDGNGWQDYTDSQGNANFVFSEVGLYNVDLRVTDDMGVPDQLDELITILVSDPLYIPPSIPPSCEGAMPHRFMGAQQILEHTNTSAVNDLAFLANGKFIMVISGALYSVMPPNMPDPVPLLEEASWVRSIDTTMSGLVALSGLNAGTINLYVATGEFDITLETLLNIVVGTPLTSICFDGDNYLFAFGGGKIYKYDAPLYELNECNIWDVSPVQDLGVVDDMEFSIWNHSLYLAVNDGGRGKVVEVNHLGNIAGQLDDVLGGPSIHMDIVTDKVALMVESTACRIEVFGGINTGYVTRIDGDLNILGTAEFGYWGIRAAACNMGLDDSVFALEACCLGWIDQFAAPLDWFDLGG